MLIIPPPTPNRERQRLFRERNPGYYRKYSARRRQMNKVAFENAAARWRAMNGVSEPLMLPAPAVTAEIPGMTVIAPAAQKVEQTTGR